jgi:P-type Mg2+ transporter
MTSQDNSRRTLKRNGAREPSGKDPFWSVPAGELLQRLETAVQGLSEAEVAARLDRYGANSLKPRRELSWPGLLLGQFKSPLVLILVAAASLAFFLHDRTNAGIILGIVVVSAVLGFWQEYSAAGAVAKLLAVVQVKVQALRDGLQRDVPVDEIVPGDVLALNAGDVVPGDCRVLESKDLFANEAALTGESFPAEKLAGVMPAETPLGGRTNVLYMGTHVVSGTGRALVVRTGRDTEFGKVSDRLRLRPPETDFERGLRRFGYLLMQVTLILVVGIFAFNVFLKRPVFDSFLFALALAVGLTPQLLPAIVSVSLSRGAQKMARQKVIVRRLASVENFGSMTVLCSDKTGTLTSGTVQVREALDEAGNASEKVLRYAFVNAVFQSGFTNPIDAAIKTQHPFDLAGWTKLDEVPYDFVRKRLSVLVEETPNAEVRTPTSGVRTSEFALRSSPSRCLLITKGALPNVLEVCTHAEQAGNQVDIAGLGEEIEGRYQWLSAKGLRVLGIAYRDTGTARTITREDEVGMTFLGFLVLEDPLKPDIADNVALLRGKGVRLKLVTGDNRLVAANIGVQVGLENPEILAGPEMHEISAEALPVLVDDVDIFAEVEPGQKERIVSALKRAGNVVGFLGDGINDAPALRAADVGISVDSAVDVAKEAADIVLLERDLGVLTHGIEAGRRTFSNTLKYVFMATSANFGNMFSMAGASLFLPFLPLLPTQILLTNLLTDLPEMTIATDHVDPEQVEKPHRWDIRFIRRFMITFGLLSSVFDYLTFGLLMLLLHANAARFRTGWFIESVLSASLIVLVIRTRRPFFRSPPRIYLALATLFVMAFTVALPWTPLGRLFGFVPLPPEFITLLAGILVLYVASAEITKRIFYRHTP